MVVNQYYPKMIATYKFITVLISSKSWKVVLDTLFQKLSGSCQLNLFVRNFKWKMNNNKYILDVCCGGRQFWFDKKQNNTIYMDIRREEKGFQDHRPNKEIQPDLLADFRFLPFPDNYFKLVVMDPPHIIATGPLFRMTKEYGWLEQDEWWQDIRNGFNECWRVLQDLGVLIFKWNEASIKRADVLNAINKDPLFGHPVLSKIGTHWFCFLKNDSL